MNTASSFNLQIKERTIHHAKRLNASVEYSRQLQRIVGSADPTTIELKKRREIVKRKTGYN